jgi:hypothetical protein
MKGKVGFLFNSPPFLSTKSEKELYKFTDSEGIPISYGTA